MKQIILLAILVGVSSLYGQGTLVPQWMKTEVSESDNAEAWGVSAEGESVYWVVSTGRTGAGLDIKGYKYDITGQPLWDVPFEYGGAGTQHAYIATTNDTSLFVGGRYCSGLINTCDMLLLNIDKANGTLKWEETLNFAGDGYDEVDAIELLEDGIYCGGWAQQLQSTPFQSEMGLWKLDYAGNTQWTNYLGKENSAEHIDGHFVVDDNHIYAAGLWGGTGTANLYNGHAFLGKFDKADGVLQDSTLFGDQSDAFLDIENALGMASDGTFLYVTGYATPVSANDWQIFVAKFDKDLNQLWYTDWGSNGTESARAIVVDNDRIYIAGVTESESLMSGEGTRDGVLLTLDLDGNVVDYKTWGDEQINSFHDLVVEGDQVYITGTSENDGDKTGFLLAYQEMPSSLDGLTQKLPTFELFPNPAQGRVEVRLDEDISTDHKLQVVDTYGRVLQEKQIDRNRFPLELNQTGVYYISIDMGMYTISKKVINQ